MSNYTQRDGHVINRTGPLSGVITDPMLCVCDDEHRGEERQEQPGVQGEPFYGVITTSAHATPVRALCTLGRPLLWWSLWPSRVCVGLAPA